MFNISIYKLSQNLIKPIISICSKISNRMKSYYKNKKINEAKSINDVTVSIQDESIEDDSISTDIEEEQNPVGNNNKIEGSLEEKEKIDKDSFKRWKNSSLRCNSKGWCR